MEMMYQNIMISWHHSTGYLSCTKNFTVPGSLLLPINALQNSFHHYLLLALKPYLLIINNNVLVFILHFNFFGSCLGLQIIFNFNKKMFSIL